MVEPVYETATTFGCQFATSRPSIVSVNIPEAKKIRHPTKHYVYKIVVQWSNGSSTVIYRRFSMFFDFMVKLQELYASLKEKNPQFQGDNCPALPDLPGRKLFGRTEVHQVAEKRRVKIEEFCEALVSLPPEISQTPLVLGFFNTWPEDTLHHSNALFRDTTSPISSTPIVFQNSPGSPTSDIVISHPEEMDNLEQYRVIVDYDRKDNHQVDLAAGQIVHVIEKHDTGWWMIVTDEEQGYAPAAHLESIDKTYDSAEPECSPDEEYEAVDSYKAENDDEIELSAGDKVVVLHKNMDGWWKIKANGRTGYCPATVIRRTIEKVQSNISTPGFESEKNIYEGLNIHKPPPRRSTLQRNMGTNIYKVPKVIKKTGSKTGDTSDLMSTHYRVPKSYHSTSSGSDDENPSRNNLTDPPFSPDHYEMGPYFESENGSTTHPIYQNANFDHPMSPTDGVTHQSHIYQNVDYDGPPQQQNGKEKLIKKLNYKDDEYVNPEEFENGKEVLNVGKKQNGLPTNIKCPDSPVKYRQVTIASNVPIPPSNSTDSSPSHPFVLKAKLTSSKSLGFIGENNGLPEDEYVEMDPIYAPVAPDEPEEIIKEEKQQPCGNDSKGILLQSVTSKKPRPPIPPPYSSVNVRKTSPERQEVSDRKGVVPRGRVLERTRSLEDILSHSDSDKMSSSQNNPDGAFKMIPIMQLGRNVPSQQNIPIKSDYDHLLILPMTSSITTPTNSTSTVTSNQTTTTKKPEPAKKKLYHKVTVNPTPPESRKIHSPPVTSPPHNSNFSKDMNDGLPPPPSLPPPQSKGSFLPKTYTAIEDYGSQAPGCISFNAGDRCILVRQSAGGWWYVNIGGREGWTPGDFWQVDQRAISVAFAQPPSMAPQKLPLTKPRSQTHITSFPESQVPPSLPPSSIDSSVNSIESRSYSFGSGNDIQKSNLPIGKPLPGRPRGQPPPKPKPITNTPLNRKIEHSLSYDMKGASPPPPPPPRRESSHPSLLDHPVNGLNKMKNGPMSPSVMDYSCLEDATAVSLDENPWFVGSMEREKAEQFLMENGRQREFLVRERKTKKDYYALSIRYHYSVKHFNIDPRPDGSYAMGVMQFSSIEGVVKHYQLHSLFVHDGQPVALGHPVRRKSKSSH